MSDDEDGCLEGSALRERSWLLEGVAMMAALGDQRGSDPSLAYSRPLELPAKMRIQSRCEAVAHEAAVAERGSVEGTGVYNGAAEVAGGS